MVKFNINTKRTALLIVDMTEGFVGEQACVPVQGAETLIPRLKKLIDKCRNKSIPVIFASHAHRANGSDLGLFDVFRPEMRAGEMFHEGSESTKICKGLKPGNEDTIITKRRFSAFLGTDLDLVLHRRGITTLIIGGVATNMCVECTARDARMRDYEVIFLSDGTMANALPDNGWGKIPAEEVQRFVLATMAYGYGQVSSVNDVIARLSKP